MKEKKLPHDPIIEDKFNQEYTSIPEFKKKTGCPLTGETIRRYIYLRRPLSPPVLLILAKYMGLSQAEIRKVLKNSGDTEFWPLIGTDKTEISEEEKNLLQIYNTIKKQDPARLNIIADTISLISKADGLDLNSHIEKIRHYEPATRGARIGRKK